MAAWAGDSRRLVGRSRPSEKTIEDVRSLAIAPAARLPPPAFLPSRLPLRRATTTRPSLAGSQPGPGRSCPALLTALVPFATPLRPSPLSPTRQLSQGATDGGPPTTDEQLHKLDDPPSGKTARRASSTDRRRPLVQRLSAAARAGCAGRVRAPSGLTVPVADALQLDGRSIPSPNFADDVAFARCETSSGLLVPVRLLSLSSPAEARPPAGRSRRHDPSSADGPWGSR